MFDFALLVIGMVFVVEGLLPFAFPKGWRDTMAKLARSSDEQVRFAGFFFLLLGALLLWLVNMDRICSP